MTAAKLTVAGCQADVDDWASAHPGRLAFDVETDGTWDLKNGGSIPTGALRCLSFSDGRDAIGFTPDLRPGQLVGAGRALVAHNAGFDIAWLARHYRLDPIGLHLRTDDTLTLARQMLPHRGLLPYVGDQSGEPFKPYALKTLGPAVLGDAWLSVQHASDAMRARYTGSNGQAKVQWAAIPLDELLPYCADDATMTMQLWRHFDRDATGPDRDVFAFERRVDAAVAGIERRGFRVSSTRCSAILDVLARNAADVMTKMKDSYGLAKVTDATVRVLLESQGAPLERKTASGDAWRVDKEVRAELELRDGPWVEPARLYGAVKDDNAWRTKLEKLLADGTAHPRINPRGALTWRWTVSSPPLHTFPKEPKTLLDGTAVDLRSMWTADPGRVLVSADYSGMEFVVAAGLSDDPGMLDAIGRHYEIMVERLGITRQQAKKFMLAGQYNQGFTSLADDLGMSLRDAQRTRAEAFGGFVCPPDCLFLAPMSAGCRSHSEWVNGLFNLRRFRRELMAETVDGVAVWRSPHGRRIALDQHHAVNYAAQGHSRDITMAAMLRAAEAGLDVWLSVHDEVVIQACPDDAADAAIELSWAMATAVGAANLVADGQVLGTRWRATEKKVASTAP